MTRMTLTHTCVECGRTFDMWDADDAIEWANGHDCEPIETQMVNGRTWRKMSNGHYALEGNANGTENDAA